MQNIELSLKASRMKLEKNFPESQVGSFVKNATDSIGDYGKSLNKDKTLTPTARRLKSRRFEAKAYKSMAETAMRRAESLLSRTEGLDRKTDAKLQRSGSMDVLILSQIATAIKDMAPKDVFALARTDLDVARCLAIDPVARVTFGTADKERQTSLRGIVEEHILTSDEQKQIAAWRKELATLADVAASADLLREQAKNAVEQIESSMAKEPELDPAA